MPSYLQILNTFRSYMITLYKNKETTILDIFNASKVAILLLSHNDAFGSTRDIHIQITGILNLLYLIVPSNSIIENENNHILSLLD